MTEIFECKMETVKAVQYTGSNVNEVFNLTNGSASKSEECIIFKDVRGDIKVFENDWIVLDAAGFRVLSDFQFNRVCGKL